MKKLILVVFFSLFLSMSAFADITNPDDGDLITHNDIQVTWDGEGEHSLTVIDADTDDLLFEHTLSENSFVVYKGLLKPGHRYKIELYPTSDSSNVSVSYFTVKDEVVIKSPVITSPREYDDVRHDAVVIGWEINKDVDHYLVSLKDKTDNTYVCKDLDTSDDHYACSTSDMKPGHEYKATVTAVKGDIEESSSITFFTKDEEAELESPRLAKVGSNQYKLSDLKISWKMDSEVDYFLFSLKDKTDNKTVLSEEKTYSTYYEISESDLEAGHTYEYTVEAVKGSASSKDKMDFEILEGSVGSVTIQRPDYNYVMPSYFEKVTIMWSGTPHADHYLVSVKDLTDNEYILERKERPNMYNSYDLDGDDLSYGHRYKIFVAAVEGSEESWDESIFTWDYPTLEYPDIEGIKKGAEVAREDIEITWEKSVSPDDYEVVLKDVTDSETVIDESTSKAKYTILKENLKAGHSYELVITVNRGEKSRERKITFDVSASVVTKPVIDAKSIYDFGDIEFDWASVEGADGYKLTLQDTTTKKMQLNDHEITDSEYVLLSDLIIDGHAYVFMVTAYNDGSAASTVLKFVVGDTLEYKVSPWAKSFTDAVIEKKLLKPEFSNQLLEKPQQSLTRVEFCRMLVGLYETYNDEAVDLAGAKPFEDISSLSDDEQMAIKKANILGIISGQSDTVFNPNGLVTRQEMAVMLYNTYKAINSSDESLYDFKDKFDDTGNIAPWALSSVKFVNAMDILNGDGKNFKPTDLATREMGFVLVEKSHKCFSSKN